MLPALWGTWRVQVRGGTEPAEELGDSAGMAVPGAAAAQGHRELGQNVGVWRGVRGSHAEGIRGQQVAAMNGVFCVGGAVASNRYSFCTLLQS